MSRFRWNAGSYLFVKGYQSNRVLLHQHQIGQSSRQANAIVELGQLLSIGVVHRLAQVHHNVAGDVGFRLVFFDVIPLGLRVRLPIDILGIVTMRIKPMFTEFGGESVVRTRVHPLQESANNHLGTEIESFDLRGQFWL